MTIVHVMKTAVVLLIALSQSLPQAPQTGIANSGIVEGFVRDSVTHKGIDGAIINISSKGGYSFALFGRSPVAARTDVNGHFIVQAVRPGTYSIFAGKQGYFGPGSGVANTNLERNITISPRQQVDSLFLELVPGATISGRVLGSDGMPLVGANVEIGEYTFDNTDGRRSIALFTGGRFDNSGATEVRNARTDDRGRYRIFPLKPGRYFLGLPQRSMGFETNVYLPGTVEQDYASTIEVKAGTELSDVDITLPAQPGVEVFTVSGIIAGLPANTSTIAIKSFYLLKSNTPDHKYAMRSNSADGLNGKFQIRGIPAGDYELLPEVRDDQENIYSSRTPIHIDKNLENLSIAVQRGVELHGRFLLDGAMLSGRSLNHLPGEVQYLLQSAEGSPEDFWNPQKPNPVDPMTGEFVIADLLPGRYFIGGDNFGDGSYYLDDIRQGSGSLLDSVLNVGDTSPAPIELRFKSNPGKIAGTVKDADGNPSSGATVLLVPQSATDKRPARYYRAASDTKGHFNQSVAPGEYKVFAWTDLPSGSPWLNKEFMTPFESKGMPVTIGEGNSMNMELTAIEMSRR